MPDRLLRPLLIAAACLLAATAARAGGAVYGPDGAPTVVQRKLYTMTGRWEAGLAFASAMNTALVTQLGALASLTYHPNEWFDLGVEGLFDDAGLSTLAQNVRIDLRARTATPHKDEFANDNQLRAGAFGVARLAPIYGKFNLASELGVHFQAFVLAGAGAASVHRESVNLCADPGTAACQSFQQGDAVKGVGELGLGVRFYLGQRVSLRTEVRGYFFPSSYKSDNDLTNPASGTPTSYLAGILFFDAGLSLLF